MPRLHRVTDQKNKVALAVVQAKSSARAGNQLASTADSAVLPYTAATETPSRYDHLPHKNHTSSSGDSLEPCRKHLTPVSHLKILVCDMDFKHGQAS